MNRPKPAGAWGITLAAALDLFAFVLLAKAATSLSALVLFGACEILLIVAATNTWKQYFEELIDFKIHQLREDREAQRPPAGNVSKAAPEA